MIKKIVVLSLFLTSIFTCTFAQTPPAQDPQEKTLVYIPSRDYKEPEYLWGVLSDYKSKYKTEYILNPILNTNSIVFSITESGVKEKPTDISDKTLAQKNALENELNKKSREKELSDMISQSFKVWFSDTKAAIEKSGRQDEFKDIMPILNKSVEPMRVSDNISNFYGVLSFHFTDEYKMHASCCSRLEIEAGLCQGVEGCAGNNVVTTVNPYASANFTKDHVRKIIIHEIGHLYGLTDQYEDVGHSDVTHTTTDRFIRGISVMGASYTTNLKCDDVDGFINLIDLTLFLRNKKWSDRAKKEGGWASFCNGKKGYKNTFYKEARVLNKKDYRNEGIVGDQCVYSYTPEGKIDKKYCPKLWTFAREADKLTYGKNGLVINKKDEKFNYKYSYYKENEVPTVKVIISSTQREYLSTKKTFDGKKAWELPAGYFVVTHGSNYIHVDDKNCNIVNYTPFSDKKSYSLDFVNGKLQPNYTYSFSIGRTLFDMHKTRSKEDPVCQVFRGDDEIIKFKKGMFSDDLTDNIGKDRTYLKTIAENNNMTREQLIKRLKTECEKVLHQSIIDNSKALCSYFKKVDDYFNK